MASSSIDPTAGRARRALGHLPTPLERLDRLTEALGGPEIWIKRDDCTGLASGGNKTRKLEFLVAAALEQGCDTLVTVGKLQSNHARQTAAAAAKVGLSCVLLLEQLTHDSPDEYVGSGNALLNDLLGATTEVFGPDARTPDVIEQRLDAIRRSGGSPYFIPSGGSNGVGALGYVAAAAEVAEQAAAANVEFDRVVLATGSGGTQAGLLVGMECLGETASVVGVSVSGDRVTLSEKVAAVAADCSRLLGAAPVAAGRVMIDDDYVGPGYGVPDRRTFEAIDLVASTEGVVLDPVYTGKAAAGLVDAVRTHQVGSDERVLLVHTGGQAANFAYRAAFTRRRG